MKLFKFSLPFIVVLAILIVEGIFISASGLDDLTRPYAYTPRDTIKAYKLDSNEVRLYNGHNKLLDTLDLKFARYLRFKDSTFDSVKAVFLRATGKATVDSLTSTRGVYCTKINTGLGNYEIGQDVHTNSDVIFDSIAARIVKFSYGIIDTALTADSINTRTIKATSFEATTCSGYSNVADSSNVGGGYLSLSSIATANKNSAYGWKALKNNAEGAENTAVGYQALENSLGSTNTACGSKALSQLTSGFSNVAIGSYALEQDTSGKFNIAIGNDAMVTHKRGNFNIAIGNGCGSTNVTDSNTTSIGANVTPPKSNCFKVDITQIINYADSAAARAAGNDNGCIYRVGGQLMIMY